MDDLLINSGGKPTEDEEEEPSILDVAEDVGDEIQEAMDKLKKEGTNGEQEQQPE